MKKILLICFCSIFLSSCFWSNDEAASGLLTLDQGDFSIQVPDSWQQLDSSDIPTPKSGEIVLAYSSQSERQGYLNNIVVLKAPIDGEKTEESLMKSTLISLEKNILNFSLISQKDLAYTDGSTGTVVSYSGRYNNTTPETIYIQSVKVCEENSYYITLSLAEKLESYDRYEYILSTLSCSS